MSSRRVLRRSRKAALTTFVATTATIASTAALSGLSISDAAVASAPQTLPTTAATHGDGHAKRDAFRNFDTRTDESRAVQRAGAQLLKSDAERIQALGKSLGVQGSLVVDALTGTPANVSRLDGSLTGPSSA